MKLSRRPGSARGNAGEGKVENGVLIDLTVAEVLDRWPQTIPVFLHHRMACVGCVMAPFETLADVAAIYGLQLSRFLSELQQTIQPMEGNR